MCLIEMKEIYEMIKIMEEILKKWKQLEKLGTGNKKII